MPLRQRRLKSATYQALQEQLATAAALCSDDQVLDLADGLHDTLRRRRRPRFIEPMGEHDLDRAHTVN